MRAEIRHTRQGVEYYLDGVSVSQEVFDAAFPSQLEDLLASGGTLPAHTPGCWPMLSEGMAVHPSQIEQATARNRRHGVNVAYTPDGRAILPDRGARRDLIKLEGYVDKHGGYGD